MLTNKAINEFKKTVKALRIISPSGLFGDECKKCPFENLPKNGYEDLFITSFLDKYNQVSWIPIGGCLRKFVDIALALGFSEEKLSFLLRHYEQKYSCDGEISCKTEKNKDSLYLKIALSIVKDMQSKNILMEIE